MTLLAGFGLEGAGVGGVAIVVGGGWTVSPVQQCRGEARNGKRRMETRTMRVIACCVPGDPLKFCRWCQTCELIQHVGQIRLDQIIRSQFRDPDLSGAEMFTDP